MKTTKKPNIILVLVDDLGYGDLSCINQKSKINTKNIDFLAAEGMRFTDCHSASALCTPSRYSLLTGRYNWRSRLKWGVMPGQAAPLIEEGRQTLGTMLQKQGYKTACVGKWHLGMDWQTKNGYTLPTTLSEPNAEQDLCFTGIDFTAPIKNGPNTRGFDYFYGMSASLDQPPFLHIENNKALTIPNQMIGVRNLERHGPGQQFDVEYGPAEPGYDPAAMVPEMDAKVLSLIDQYSGQDAPFFIYYPTLAVHGPLVPAPEFKGKSGLNAYADFVLQVDDFMGRLQNKLREKKIDDNTIVIFTSDNGCSAVADFPALIAKGHNPSYLFRGCKSDIWEGGHRVPFIIRWPKNIPSGLECNQTVCLVDMFATLAELTGATYADNAAEDSISMVSLFKDPQEKTREYLVHHSGNGSFSIRKGDWKLELCSGSGGMWENASQGALPYQLYHLEGDISEQYNLYGRYPEVEQELLGVLTEYLEKGRSTPGVVQENYPCEQWPGLAWLTKDVERK